MTATVRITGDGASVDGRLVEVPAGLDLVRCCLDRVCRDDGPVRALIVDERDAWEYRVPVHPDGHVEEDLNPPRAVRDAVRVGVRRSRVGPVAAIVAVLALASWLAVDAARTKPPSASPGSTALQGTAPLTVPPPRRGLCRHPQGPACASARRGRAGTIHRRCVGVHLKGAPRSGL